MEHDLVGVMCVNEKSVGRAIGLGWGYRRMEGGKISLLGGLVLLLHSQGLQL